VKNIFRMLFQPSIKKVMGLWNIGGPIHPTGVWNQKTYILKKLTTSSSAAVFMDSFLSLWQTRSTKKGFISRRK